MASNGIVGATIWSGIQRFGGLAISFVSNIVLARLLSPDDFGTMGLIMAFISIADVLVDGGLGNALIQKKTLEEKDKTTIFSANLFFSIVLFSILILIAPYVEVFTNINGFSTLLRVQSVCVLIRAFYVINVSQITRELKYSKLAQITLISQFVSTVMAIIMAHNGMGVWSLLLKTILLDFICCFLYSIVSPFNYKIAFDRESFKGLFGFGFPVAVANIIESLYANFVSFIIGKAYSVRDLGFFNQANSLKQIPVYSVSGIINQVSFPFFSRIQDDSNELRNKFRNTIKIVTLMVYPILSFMIFFADPVITTLYSEKWLPCVPMFRVLCLSGYFNALYHLSRSTIKAIGLSKLLLYTQLLSAVISLVFVGFFLRYSILTFIWVFVIDSIMSYSIVGFFIGKSIGYSLVKQMCDIAPNLIISFISAFVSLRISLFCNIAVLVKLLLFFILNIIIFIGANLILKNKTAIMLINIFYNHLVKSDNTIVG